MRRAGLGRVVVISTRHVGNADRDNIEAAVPSWLLLIPFVVINLHFIVSKVCLPLPVKHPDCPSPSDGSPTNILLHPHRWSTTL